MVLSFKIKPKKHAFLYITLVFFVLILNERGTGMNKVNIGQFLSYYSDHYLDTITKGMISVPGIKEPKGMKCKRNRI